MANILPIVGAVPEGQVQAIDQLLPLVYDELRKLAASKLSNEPSGHTLDATGLVHEVYLRLGSSPRFESRSQFFRIASEAMRRILIDHARKKRAEKRGNTGKRFELSESDRVVIPDPDLLLSVDQLLNRFALEDPNAAELARLKLFTGLSTEEAADILGISRATAFRDWAFVRAWLSDSLKQRS